MNKEKLGASAERYMVWVERAPNRVQNTSKGSRLAGSQICIKALDEIQIHAGARKRRHAGEEKDNHAVLSVHGPRWYCENIRKVRSPRQRKIDNFATKLVPL